MNVKSNWITSKRFSELKPINVFHKEYSTSDFPPSKVEDYHVALRSIFHVSSEQNHVIRISADDYYKLYINGRFVGQGPKPSYPDAQTFNEFDVTSFLEIGDNSIVAHVYYLGRVNRVFNSADHRCGLVLDVLADDVLVWGTDSSWQYLELEMYSGREMVGYETAFLEDIDFRQEEKGWKEKKHDTREWGFAEIMNEDYRMLDQPTAAVDVYRMDPVKVERLGSGHYFIDFGREITGQFYMAMQGEPDQRVVIRCGEELDESGQVRFDMRANCRYEETCILSGQWDEFDFYDYKAFRYVEVLTAVDNLNPASFAAIVRHHRFEPIQVLKTENVTLAAIWEICENALRCGAQELLVDCPSREKGQYLGDFTVSGLAHLYLTGDRDYYLGILRDFARSTAICPGLMAVVPGSFMQEIADFSLLFGLQVLNYYRYTGDAAVLEEFFPTIEGILAHFSQYERGDGLLEGVSDKWNLVDWPANLRDDYDFDLPARARADGCHNVINAYYIGAWKVRDEIASILGRAVDTAKTAERAQRFNAAFFNAETGLYVDSTSSKHSSLHANALPLYFEFAVESAQDTMRDFILAKGLCCGVFFAYFVLQGLCNVGAVDEAYALMLNESEHGWVNMLREGATSTFEAWGKDQKWNTSLCHPWAAAPVILLNESFRGRYGNDIVARRIK